MFLFMVLQLMIQKDVVWEMKASNIDAFMIRLDVGIVTTDEDLYFLDQYNHRIVHLSKAGKYVHTFNIKGPGPGEIGYGFDLQYISNLKGLFIKDGYKNKLVGLNMNGTPHELDNHFDKKPSPLIIDSKTVVYISDDASSKNMRSGARLILESVDTLESKILLNNDSQRHHGPSRVNVKGSSGTMDFDWNARTLMAVSPDRKWLAMGSNISLDFLLYDLPKNEFTRSLKDNTALIRPPLTVAEIEAHRESLTLNGKKFTAKDFNHPEFKPPIQGILWDRLGRLWVELTSQWKANQRNFRVYGRDSSSVGSLSLPRSDRVILAIGGDHLWVSAYFEDTDEWTVQKRRYQLSPLEN